MGSGQSNAAAAAGPQTARPSGGALPPLKGAAPPATARPEQPPTRGGSRKLPGATKDADEAEGMVANLPGTRDPTMCSVDYCRKAAGGTGGAEKPTPRPPEGARPSRRGSFALNSTTSAARRGVAATSMGASFVLGRGEADMLANPFFDGDVVFGASAPDADAPPEVLRPLSRLTKVLEEMDTVADKLEKRPSAAERAQLTKRDEDLRKSAVKTRQQLAEALLDRRQQLGLPGAAVGPTLGLLDAMRGPAAPCDAALFQAIVGRFAATLPLARKVTEQRWAHGLAAAGAPNFLAPLLGVAGVCEALAKQPVAVQELVRTAAGHEERSVSVMSAIVNRSERLGLAHHREVLRPVWQSFFERMCSPAGRVDETPGRLGLLHRLATDDVTFGVNAGRVADKDRMTPLTRACVEGDSDVVRLFATKRLDDLNSFRPGSPTPLTAAAANGHLDCVDALLSQSVTDPLLADGNGETPADAARRGGRNDVVEAIRRATGERERRAAEVQAECSPMPAALQAAGKSVDPESVLDGTMTNRVASPTRTGKLADPSRRHTSFTRTERGIVQTTVMPDRVVHTVLDEPNVKPPPGSDAAAKPKLPSGPLSPPIRTEAKPPGKVVRMPSFGGAESATMGVTLGDGTNVDFGQSSAPAKSLATLVDLPDAELVPTVAFQSMRCAVRALNNGWGQAKTMPATVAILHMAAVRLTVSRGVRAMSRSTIVRDRSFVAELEKTLDRVVHDGDGVTGNVPLAHALLTGAVGVDTRSMVRRNEWFAAAVRGGHHRLLSVLLSIHAELPAGEAIELFHLVLDGRHRAGASAVLLPLAAGLFKPHHAELLPQWRSLFEAVAFPAPDEKETEAVLPAAERAALAIQLATDPDVAVDLAAPDSHGTSLLCRAVRVGSLPLATELLRRGLVPDPAAPCPSGTTALIEAVRRSDAGLVWLLIRHNAADFEYKQPGCGTALDVATEMRCDRAVMQLLQEHRFRGRHAGASGSRH